MKKLLIGLAALVASGAGFAIGHALFPGLFWFTGMSLLSACAVSAALTAPVIALVLLDE